MQISGNVFYVFECICPCYLFVCFFFPFWVFFHKHSQIMGLQGKGEGISLTPHYHFHPLHTHLDISRAITAESSPLHILAAGLELVSKCKSLTINLCSLKKIYFHEKIFPGNLLLWTVSQKLQIHGRFWEYKSEI